MKFISWNVNGLRACVQKGFLDFFNSIDADFFCIQESKLQAGQIDIDLPDFPSASYSQKLIFLCTSYTTPIIQSTHDLLLLHRQIPLLRKNHIYSTLVRFVSPDKFHSEPSPQI